MPALLDIQRSMRTHLLAEPADVERPWEGAEREALAIYRNTVISALVKALQLSYPAVQRLVGAEFFEGAARAFIGAHAPTSACLNDYGDRLPDFLARFAPAQTLPYLVEVAQLEWAVNVALRAPDVLPLELQRLATLAESELPRLTFTAHPAVGLLHLRYPADQIWRAVLDQDSETMAHIDLSSGPVHLLIERDGHAVEVRRLTPGAWGFTRCLVGGMPLHAAMAADGAPEGDALNALLAEHLTRGRFVDFSPSGDSQT